MSRCGVPGATTTISSAADALLLAQCGPTLDGSITVASSYSGDLGFYGIKEITGSLIAQNAPGLTSLLSMDLTTIGDSLILDSLTAIANITFPALKSAPTLTVNWAGPVLSHVNFTSYDGPGNVTFSNTWIETLGAPSFQPTTLDSLTVTINRQLEQIDLQSLTGSIQSLTVMQNSGMPSLNLSGLTTISDSLSVTQVSALDLSNLNTAGSMNISGAVLPSLDLPSLTTADSLSIIANPQLSTLNAPILHTISGINTSSPSSASSPSFLSTADALTITNNTLLTSTITLPALTTLTGSASLAGTFYSVSLPRLSSFSSSLTLQSTRDINSTCAFFSSATSPETSGLLIPGGVTCIYPGSSGSHTSADRKLSVAAIASAAVGGFVVCVLLGLLVWVVWSMRGRRKRRSEVEMKRMQKMSWEKMERDRSRARRWPGYGDRESGVGGFF